MKRSDLKHFVLFAALLLSFGTISSVSAQNLKARDWQADVIAAFDPQCATEHFPKHRLRGQIERASRQLKEAYPHREWDGKFAVAYDLDGDGRKEYFVWLKDTGIGDNVVWGVFALRPTRFLGAVFAERIYLRRRVSGWAALTASSHLSVSDSNITTYGYRGGKYAKVAGDYQVSADRDDAPLFFEKTSSLSLCRP